MLTLTAAQLRDQIRLHNLLKQKKPGVLLLWTGANCYRICRNWSLTPSTWDGIRVIRLSR